MHSNHIFLCLAVLSFPRTCKPWQIPTKSNNRREVLERGFLSTVAVFGGWSQTTAAAWAIDGENSSSQIVRVVVSDANDSIGVRVYNSKLRGRQVVAIDRLIQPKNPKLEEGMVLKGFSSSRDLAQKLRYGPFPIELEFVNLAAGGDAISDMGTSIVTPKDALTLAQQTEAPPASQQGQQSYSITSLKPPQPLCKMQSRRGDVLEINYEARYRGANGQVELYDSSAFRGTGQPYQMVLGSGDMIAGVDQGLYDMCPGDVRRLEIPPQLGHGPRSRSKFGIPVDYAALDWSVLLVSIDGTIRKENNDQSREEREGRASY